MWEMPIWIHLFVNLPYVIMYPDTRKVWKLKTKFKKKSSSNNGKQKPTCLPPPSLSPQVNQVISLFGTKFHSLGNLCYKIVLSEMFTLLSYKQATGIGKGEKGRTRVSTLRTCGVFPALPFWPEHEVSSVPHKPALLGFLSCQNKRGMLGYWFSVFHLNLVICYRHFSNIWYYYTSNWFILLLKIITFYF